MTYSPDEWRNRSIVAQTAAKVAADLVVALVSQPDYGKVGSSILAEEFEFLHTKVFDSVMSLTGEAETAPGPGPTDTAPATPRPGGKRPYADVEIKFGKYKGMTISQIDVAISEDGKTGHSWLEWAADNVTNEFTQKALRAYLGR